MTYEITLNAQYNSTEVTFTEKPGEAIREVLKGMGFRWHKVRGLWYGYKDAETVKKALDSIEDAEVSTETASKAEKATGTPQDHIKFYYNGIKIDGGKLIKCGYYLRENGSLCISALHYDNLPRDLFDVENETDLYTDYFDNDSATLTAEHPLYKYAKYAALKAKAKDAERAVKYNEKEMQRGEIWPGFLENRREEIERRKKVLADFATVQDPGQPTAEDIAQIDADRQKAENERREAEHTARLKLREKALNRRANGRRFIEEVAKVHPIEENAPTVEIPFSEDPAFYSWTTSVDRTRIIVHPDGTKETEVIEPARKLVLSPAAAEIVLYHFDMIDPDGPGYCKTDFVIHYTNPETGEAGTYEGRYDLGDRDGGLLQHIRTIGEWHLTHDRFGHKKAEPDTTNDVLEFADYLSQFIA